MLLVVLAASCSNDPKPIAQPTTTTRITTTTSTTAAPTTTTTIVPVGSQGNPLPAGTMWRAGDWEVTLVSFTPDANAQIAAANQFNDPPAAGSVYSMVRIRATYRGDGEGHPVFGIDLGYVGSDRRVYSDNSCQAVVPDGLSDQPEVQNGGTVEGNECFELPTGVVGTGLVFIEDGTAFGEDTRAWFRP